MTATQHQSPPPRPVFRPVLVAMGAIAALLGLAAATVSVALLWVHATQRDDSGYFTTNTQRFATASYALTKTVDLGDSRVRGGGARHPVGTVRIQVHPEAGTATFVGIGRAPAVDAYLRNVAHEEVTGADFGPFDSNQSVVSGTRAPTLPGEQSFWESAVSGKRSTEELQWPSKRGEWTLVVMNADASAGVRADVSVGAKTALLLGIGIVAGVGALMLFVAAAAMMFVGLRSHVAGSVVAAPPVNPASYPVRLGGRLEEPLSRWLWIVKPILLIPHAIALALLWTATAVLTVVAGVAILLTGRYPRSIFDFNVGVMRWTWRVGFYSFNALGTDRYPPFSMQADPEYPADFTVEYPEHLSRGLVLVKWWLLAIPHYLIVAFFTGGLGLGFGGPRLVSGAGLISVLAVVAGLTLLFTARYPHSLFDFMMGLNRWCYRVLAYVALMRDEYPPFRFDGGGTDPGDLPARTVPGAPSPRRPAHV